MKKFTLILSLLVAMVTTAMGQSIFKKISHSDWEVTACNETPEQSNGREGGTAFIADDKPNTFYHSDWKGDDNTSGNVGLQAFMIKLPAAQEISLISYIGRSDEKTSGWAKSLRIYIYNELPEGFPAGGLSSLTSETKDEFLKRDNNTVLGTPAFDNYNNEWPSNTNIKIAKLSTPVTGKYVLFVQDKKVDNWFTCSDIQLYSESELTIEVDKPYKLKIENAEAVISLSSVSHSGISRRNRED